MTSALYFDDFSVGQKFTTESFTIDKDYAIDFAREYDPQYFHVDEKASLDSPFGKLAVSGWQTAAITMRLKAGSELGKISRGLVGLGLEYLKWPRPVYPGDTLRLVITITDKRASESKPTHGIIKYKVETLNQNDELVQEMMTAVWVPKK